MKILLTGGSGMVGQNTLAHPDAKTHLILAPSSTELDLSNSAAVFDYVKHNKPDLVIHAAGRVGGIHANMSEPVAFLEQNTMIGRNILMAAYQFGVPNVLNLSSTCVYPRSAPNPLSEKQILTGELEPTNEGYALAKIFAMRLCQYMMTERPDLNYKTLVPCNLYGLYDNFDPIRSHLVPAIVHKLHRAKEESLNEVEIWGDGTARREFMFAADLADAIMRAVSNLQTLPPVMNVGLGRDFSINEYYQTAAEVIGWSGSFYHNLDKPVGMKQKLSCIGLQNAWGWAPPTKLRSGLDLTYKHFLQRIAE